MSQLQYSTITLRIKPEERRGVELLRERGKTIIAIFRKGLLISLKEIKKENKEEKCES